MSRPRSALLRPWTRPEGVAPLSRDARILIAANSLSALGTGVAGPYLVLFLVRDQATVSPAVFFLVLLLLDLLTQRWVAPRIERTRGLRGTAVLGGLLQGLGWASLSLPLGLAGTLAAAGLIGVGNGLFFSVRFNLQMRVTEPGARPYAFSLRFLFGNVGIIGGALLGSILIAAIGSGAVRILFMLNALSFVALVGWLSTMASHEAEQPPAGNAGSYRTEVAGLGAAALYLASLTLVGSLTESVLPTQWVQHDRLPLALGGAAFGVLCALIVAVQLPITRAVSRVAAPGQLAFCAGLASAAALSSLALRAAGLWEVQIGVCVLLMALFSTAYISTVPRVLELFDGSAREVQGRRFAFVHSIGVYAGTAIGAAAVSADPIGVYLLMLLGSAFLAVWGVTTLRMEQRRVTTAGHRDEVWLKTGMPSSK